MACPASQQKRTNWACDSFTAGPFVRLVEGELRDLDDLRGAARLIRTIVLHDDVVIEVALLPYTCLIITPDAPSKRTSLRKRTSFAGCGKSARK